MVKVKLYTGQDWFLSRITKTNVDLLINNLMRSEMDLLIIIDGYEGTGKSFMARSLARYIATMLRKAFPNTTFGVEDITFDTQEYVNASVTAGSIHTSKKVKINVLDEGRHALNRKSSTSRGNKIFTNYLSECRAMQQVHIILAPAFHDLDRNVVLWRTNMILHSIKNYKPDKDSLTGFKLARGRFHLYANKTDIARQYQFPYNYPIHNEDSSTWSSVEVFTPEELKAYDDKKYAATIRKYHQLNDDELAIEDMTKTNAIVKAAKVAKYLGVTTLAIRHRIERGELKGRKISKFWYLEIADVKEKMGLDFASMDKGVRK